MLLWVSVRRKIDVDPVIQMRLSAGDVPELQEHMLRHATCRGACRPRRLAELNLDGRGLARQGDGVAGRTDHFGRLNWGWFHGLDIPGYQRRSGRCRNEWILSVVIIVAQRRRRRVDDLGRSE